MLLPRLDHRLVLLLLVIGVHLLLLVMALTTGRRERIQVVEQALTLFFLPEPKPKETPPTVEPVPPPARVDRVDRSAAIPSVTTAPS